MYDKTSLYYLIYILGEVQFNQDKTMVLNADGTPKVLFVRKTAPPTELQTNSNLKPNPWMHCQLVEANVGSDKITAASGKSYEIGPLVRKPYNHNLFYNTHREVFMQVVKRIEGGKYEWISKPTVDWKTGDPAPTILIKGTSANMDYALPGHAYEFETGFWYTPHSRNPQTHILEPLKSTSYNRTTGKVERNEVRKNTGTIFLFNNEIAAAEAHIKNMINSLLPFKVADIEETERKEEATTQHAPEVETGTEIPPV